MLPDTRRSLELSTFSPKYSTVIVSNAAELYGYAISGLPVLFSRQFLEARTFQ